MESTLLLKHLPGEALGKSKQGSFQTEGLRACGPSPRKRPASWGDQAARLPTGPHRVDPRALRLQGKRGAIRGGLSLWGSKKAGGQQGAQQVAGPPLCPLSGDTREAPPCVWCHPREGRPALGESQPGLHATPSFA